MESGISGCVPVSTGIVKTDHWGGMQSKIAVACKAIRVFFVILQTGCDFDEERFRKDIIRPQERKEK